LLLLLVIRIDRPSLAFLWWWLGRLHRQLVFRL